MSDRLGMAEKMQTGLREELQAEASALKARLDRGDLVEVEKLKEWRRAWIDRVVPIRKLARQVKEAGDTSTADDIKEKATDLEDFIRELEDKLLDDARILEEADERGGVLTAEERAARASEEVTKRRFSCEQCDAAVPDSETAVCAFCGFVLKEDVQQVSTGWMVLDEQARKQPTSAPLLHQAAMERIKMLTATYIAQLDQEIEGLKLVLGAGKRRTEEFEHACDDAGVRLDRIWEKVRQVRGDAVDRLGDMDADDLEQQLDDHGDKLLEQLDALRSSRLGGMQREAQLAWNRTVSATDGKISCGHCYAELEVENPWQPGEATCDFCGGGTKYAAQVHSFEKQVHKKKDVQMASQRPAEEEYSHWQAVCITDGTPENFEKLEGAARAMYDKQLFYIKDPDKRRKAVDRYVSQALKEARQNG